MRMLYLSLRNKIHKIIYDSLHNFHLQIKVAANARDPSLSIYEVCCINVRGRSEFPIEEELSKLPIAVPIDDKSRICKLCLKKLPKQKSLYFQCINTANYRCQTLRSDMRKTAEIMQTYDLN